MKYHVIYKVTNLKNEKIYVGYHSTSNLEDDYLGSGKLIKKAIEKYGPENFKREILHVFDNMEEALSKEREIVTEEFINDERTYNLQIGGWGGWNYINKLKENEAYNQEIGTKISNSLKIAYKEGRSQGWLCNGPGHSGRKKGYSHTEASKKKMSDKRRELAELEVQKIVKDRRKDFEEDNKSWGMYERLAKKWNVSHTQARRFIRRYLNNGK